MLHGASQNPLWLHNIGDKSEWSLQHARPKVATVGSDTKHSGKQVPIFQQIPPEYWHHPTERHDVTPQKALFLKLSVTNIPVSSSVLHAVYNKILKFKFLKF
jgi:hypothetical protein